MAGEIKYTWGTLTDLTVTNLESLADGNIWQSGEINDGEPSNEVVEVSYKCVFNTTPVAGDHLKIFQAFGDQAASNEIWDGVIGVSESEISAAASVAAVLSALSPVFVHSWRTNHGTTFQKVLVLPLVWPSWQLLIQASGEALTTGNIVRYRYGTPQVQ